MSDYEQDPRLVPHSPVEDDISADVAWPATGPAELMPDQPVAVVPPISGQPMAEAYAMPPAAVPEQAEPEIIVPAATPSQEAQPDKPGERTQMFMNLVHDLVDKQDAAHKRTHDLLEQVVLSDKKTPSVTVAQVTDASEPVAPPHPPEALEQKPLFAPNPVPAPVQRPERSTPAQFTPLKDASLAEAVVKVAAAKMDAADQRAARPWLGAALSVPPRGTPPRPVVPANVAPVDPLDYPEQTSTEYGSSRRGFGIVAALGLVAVVGVGAVAAEHHFHHGVAPNAGAQGDTHATAVTHKKKAAAPTGDSSAAAKGKTKTAAGAQPGATQTPTTPAAPAKAFVYTPVSATPGNCGITGPTISLSAPNSKTPAVQAPFFIQMKHGGSTVRFPSAHKVADKDHLLKVQNAKVTTSLCVEAGDVSITDKGTAGAIATVALNNVVVDSAVTLGGGHVSITIPHELPKSNSAAYGKSGAKLIREYLHNPNAAHATQIGNLASAAVVEAAGSKATAAIEQQIEQRIAAEIQQQAKAQGKQVTIQWSGASPLLIRQFAAEHNMQGAHNISYGALYAKQATSQGKVTVK